MYSKHDEIQFVIPISFDNPSGSLLSTPDSQKEDPLDVYLKLGYYRACTSVSKGGALTNIKQIAEVIEQDFFVVLPKGE